MRHWLLLNQYLNSLNESNRRLDWSAVVPLPSIKCSTDWRAQNRSSSTKTDGCRTRRDLSSLAARWSTRRALQHKEWGKCIVLVPLEKWDREYRGSPCGCRMRALWTERQSFRSERRDTLSKCQISMCRRTGRTRWGSPFSYPFPSGDVRSCDVSELQAVFW